TSTSATYFVDGQLIAQHSFPPPGPAAPAASDLVVDGNSVRVDWVHMSPYAASTTFVSRVFDANGPVAWGALAWTADTPAGHSLTRSEERRVGKECRCGWSRSDEKKG